MADVEGSGGGVRSVTAAAAATRIDATEAALRLESDDGTDGITTAVEQHFLDWLAAQGASFPKIQWPARDTVGAVRGTVALADIAGGEKDMLCVPATLVMSPASARASATIGHVFRDGEAFRHAGGYGKYETTVFLMHERLKGEASFWYPYIASLPEPRTVADWTAAELRELQHESFTDELPDQQRHVAKKYEEVFGHLRTHFPRDFPAEKYDLELFRWAYLTVQARAFGRRLDWMALVPFADNLNHANVPVKYDFNVQGNGLFRLYPSPGAPGYQRGAEVFNSYGRRDNQHLLLHYGFALPGNEWDTYEVVLGIDSLFANSEASAKAKGRTKETRRRQKNRHGGGAGSGGPGSGGGRGGGGGRRGAGSDSSGSGDDGGGYDGGGDDGGGMMDGTEDDDGDLVARGLQTRIRRLARFMRPRAKFKFRHGVFQWELLRLYRLANADPAGPARDVLGGLSLSQLSARFDAPIEQESERAALLQMTSDLQSLLAHFPTTMQQDETLLRQLTSGLEPTVPPVEAGSDDADDGANGVEARSSAGNGEGGAGALLPMRWQSAVEYRLQRKRLIKLQVDWCQRLYIALSGGESVWQGLRSEVAAVVAAESTAAAEAQATDGDEPAEGGEAGRHAVTTSDALWKTHYATQANKGLQTWVEAVATAGFLGAQENGCGE